MITAFLPCRSGSQRVPEKNTKDFAGISGGLLKIKLTQLLKSTEIDCILLSTNDEKVKKISRQISNEIIIDDRPDALASSSTSTDDLINYVPKVIKEGHVLWTHTTSPFLNEEDYDNAIITYKEIIKEKEFDSLFSVKKIQSFIWDEKGSLNYDRKLEKWPRTQTLKKIYEIDSGIFINSVDNYKQFKDRIGEKPFMLENSEIKSFDIDWPEDFTIAELLYKNR